MKVFGRSIRWSRLFIVAAIAVLLFTFLGPFNTYLNTPVVPRLVFWASLVLGNGLFFHFIVMYAPHHPRLAGWPRIGRLLLGCFVSSFPGLLVFWLLILACVAGCMNSRSTYICGLRCS